MKCLIIAILSLFSWAPFFSYGQSMVQVFKLLPTECIPEFSSIQRNTLIRNKEFAAPNEETGETTRYTLEIDEKLNYLKYAYYYSYGEKGFTLYEVRKFKRKDGSCLIVFSTFGGVSRSYNQTAIYGFNYRSKKLIRLNRPILPAKIDANVFLKLNTPDSIRAEVMKYSSRSYDLSPDRSNSIRYSIFVEILDDTIESYLIGDTVDFL